MTRPTVTVLIPTFNCGQWITEAIESALRQTVAPLEIIVVDDGSTDETAAILSTYGTRIRAMLQPNSGVAAARNTGLRAARGDWIAFLDADDVWHPRKLELQLKAVATTPRVGLLATDVTAWPERRLESVTGDAPPPPRCIECAAMAVRNHLTTSSVLVRRSVVEQVGEFDVSLCGPEDHDYWLRVAEVEPIAVLPLPLTGYRCVPGSLSKRAAAMEAGMKRILRKLDARDFWRGDLWLRRRAYSFVEYSCAYLHGTAGNQLLAVWKLVRSIAWYPMPQKRSEVGDTYARSKRLGVTLLRLFRLKRVDLGY